MSAIFAFFIAVIVVLHWTVLTVPNTKCVKIPSKIKTCRKIEQ